MKGAKTESGGRQADRHRMYAFKAAFALKAV